MNPMSKLRGLCLASTATQTPGGTALASSTDTSGHHDKVPVLTQACRVSNVLFALFYPGRLIRNQIMMLWRACRNRLSLLMGTPSAREWTSLRRVPSDKDSVSWLSRLWLSTQRLKSAPDGAFLSSPWTCWINTHSTMRCREPIYRARPGAFRKEIW